MLGRPRPRLRLELLAAEEEASALKPCGVLPEQPVHGPQDGPRHAVVLLGVPFLRTESAAGSWQFGRHSLI